MSTRNIIVIAVIVCLGALGGYFMGSRGPGGPVGTYDSNSFDVGQSESPGGQGQPSQTYTASGQPIDHTEVLSGLKERLKTNPDDFHVLSSLGDTYFEMMRFEDALGYYKRAVEVNSDDVDTYNDLGLTSHYMGKSADALTYVDEGIKRNPYYQRIWLTRGFILAYGVGDQQGAVESWEKCRSIAPDTPIGKAATEYLVEFSGR